MHVLANGFPKSGTHALWKACYLLGVNAEHGHFEGLPEGTRKHVFVRRDPRNVICSTLRSEGLPVTQGSFIAKFRSSRSGLSMIDAMRPMEKWLLDPGVFIVEYEEFIQSDAPMKKMAEYLAVDWIDDAFVNLPGHTRTWNALHSSFKDVWSDSVQSVWKNEGGNELLSRWGYG